MFDEAVNFLNSQMSVSTIATGFSMVVLAYLAGKKMVTISRDAVMVVITGLKSSLQGFPTTWVAAACLFIGGATIAGLGYANVRSVDSRITPYQVKRLITEKEVTPVMLKEVLDYSDKYHNESDIIDGYEERSLQIGYTAFMGGISMILAGVAIFVYYAATNKNASVTCILR